MIADPVLVLVDMQNDFCKPGFAFLEEPRPGIQRAVERAAAFLERYRATGRTPVLVRTHHSENSTSAVWRAKYDLDDGGMPCRPGTPGAAFVDELDPDDADEVVTKHRYSAFFNTRLGTLLSANDVSELLVGGVNTQICVASTVHGAFNRDYGVTTLADCCGSSTPEQHESALAAFETTFGRVAGTDEVDLEPLPERA